MQNLYNDIINEINKLRHLKQSVFEDEYNQCDITASNICLSADILLLPLYWYVISTGNVEANPIEEYMREQVLTFEKKASMLIPHLMRRTRELDNMYSTKPFKQYRALLKSCFPQYDTSL